MANSLSHSVGSSPPHRSFLLLLLVLATGVQACGQAPEAPPQPEIVTIDDAEAAQAAERAAEEVSVTLADGLEIDLWASGPLVRDPVALHMDDLGRAWITMTNRSNSSEFDIRRWPQWTTVALSFRTLEDRRAFLRSYFAPERSEENADRIPDHNEDGLHDWRDLTVEKEEVYLIQDLTGNGKANQSQLFIRDFHEEITDVAASVLHHAGDVYVGVAPDVWRLRDTTGDGMADFKESISHGYGVHIGIWGHGVSGLTLGPDGRLYWSIGDPGFNIVDQEGNHWDYPHQGAIFRSEPDGSNFEVFARGLRNTHEFAFDKYGNLITVDNDGDFPGEFERLLYLINGADGGWRSHWQHGKYTDERNNAYNVWSHESYYHPRFDDQAAHVLPAIAEFHNGPAGMAYNPGTALNDRWKDHFFVVSFVGSPVRSAINAITLEPDGATFRLASDEQFLRGIAGTGLDFGPDGALYLADWIEGWSQNQEGRIWRIDTPDEAGSDRREEARQLLASSFDDREGDDLLHLLGHDDMRVRLKAQMELAARGSGDMLRQALESDHQLRRIHGIWGIGQMARAELAEAEALVHLLRDHDAGIRAQAAKTLGDVRFAPAADALVDLLQDEGERPRFFAAEALGRIAYEAAFDPIVDMLRANDDEDIYLRQGGAIALGRIDDGERLAALAAHPSRAVRIAAVIALKNLEHPALALFLDDEDEYVVTNAARAINDDHHVVEALPSLSRMLEQDRFTNEPLIRRAINAALYSGSEQDAARLAQYAARPGIPEALRAEALYGLSVWPEPSELDRVSGRYRGPFQNETAYAVRAIEPVIENLLFDDVPDVQLAAVHAVRGLGHREANNHLALLLEEASSPTVRVAALETLYELDHAGMEEAFASALGDGDGRVRQAALGLLPESGIEREVLVSLLSGVLETSPIDEKQVAIDVLGNVDHSSAHELLGDYLESLLAGDLAPELELEVVQAVEGATAAGLGSRLEAYYAARAEDPVARYGAALFGGDADRGREIFYQHGGAQCVRCHAVDGSGSDVGPELTDVGSRLSRELLLQSLVAPSERIAPGYGSVTVTLDDGTNLQGVLEAETESTVTIRSSGELHEIPASKIEERVNAPSGMPSMREILSPRELRDLVEFMATLR